MYMDTVGVEVGVSQGSIPDKRRMILASLSARYPGCQTILTIYIEDNCLSFFGLPKKVSGSDEDFRLHVDISI